MPRTIQDIKPSPRRAHQRDEVVIPVHTVKEKEIEKNLPPLPRHEIPFEAGEPRHSSRYALWYVAAACLIGFFLSLSFLFEHATVTVTPKSMMIPLDASDSFTAQKDATDSDAVVYSVMSLSGNESMKIPGTQSQSQALPATGTVLLYNAYSANPYKLVVNTRLATSDGRIYRLHSPATIPGYTKANGVVVPGSAPVLVAAAEPGEASNLDAGDFTLPGLAGTPQASKIYGRTKTPISGGVSGVMYTVPQDAANAAMGTLRDKLKQSLTAKAKVQVPDGYLFYDGATLFNSDDSVVAPYSKEKDIPLSLSGTLTTYLIKQDTLETAIAQKSISQYNNEPITIPNLYSLKLAPTYKQNPTTDTTFTFSLIGSANVLWTIDSESIKTLLAAKKKADFQSLLSAIPGVDRAELVIKPFWKQSFPDDPKKIEIVVK